MEPEKYKQYNQEIQPEPEKIIKKNNQKNNQNNQEKMIKHGTFSIIAASKRYLIKKDLLEVSRMKIKKSILLFIAACVLCTGFPFGISAYAKTTNPGNVNIVGAPTQKVWTFQANKSGIYHINFTYARSWEKDAPAKTVEYTVKVTRKNGSKAKTVDLSADKTNTVCKNQKFTVTLEENASTGYSWSYDTDAQGIKLVE
jgi:Predicted secreted protein